MLLQLKKRQSCAGCLVSGCSVVFIYLYSITRSNFGIAECDIRFIGRNITCEITGSHGGEYEDDCRGFSLK
jgi:hypothetical protein